jgi:hypothetical protein
VKELRGLIREVGEQSIDANLAKQDFVQFI